MFLHYVLQLDYQLQLSYISTLYVNSPIRSTLSQALELVKLRLHLALHLVNAYLNVQPLDLHPLHLLCTLPSVRTIVN